MDASDRTLRVIGVAIALVIAFVVYGVAREAHVSNECLRLGYWTGVWGPSRGSWCGRMENNTQVVFTLEQARLRAVR